MKGRFAPGSVDSPAQRNTACQTPRVYADPPWLELLQIGLRCWDCGASLRPWLGRGMRQLALPAKPLLRRFPPSLERHVKHRHQENADRTCRKHAAEYRSADRPAADFGGTG